MEKNWFIIKKDHHRGPFYSSDIETFLDHGKIDKDTMMWKESLEDWISLGDVGEFSKLFLPPLPVTPSLEKECMVNHFDDLPPQVPLECRKPVKKRAIISKSNVFDKKAVKKDAKIIKLPVVSKTKTKTKITTTENKVSKRFVFQEYIAPIKYAMAGATCLFLLFITYTITSNIKKDQSFTKLNREEFKRLNTHRKKKFTGKPKMDLAFSKKGNTLWASTNISGPATMYLNLKSIEGRVLSKTKIEANSKSILTNKALKFEKFNFKEGASLPLGEYEATVVGIRTGIQNKADQFLGKRNPAAKKIVYKTRVAIYGKSKKKFESRLKKLKRSLKLEKSLPLQDRIEKYRTLGALVDRIGLIYGQSLTKMRRPGKMRKFETDYSMSVGPILQGIILDNHEKSRTLRRKNPRRAKKYLQLLEYGKRIGELASDMVTMTTKFKVLNKSKRAHLRLIFTKKVNDLKKLANTRLNKLTRLH